MLIDKNTSLTASAPLRAWLAACVGLFGFAAASTGGGIAAPLQAAGQSGYSLDTFAFSALDSSASFYKDSDRIAAVGDGQACLTAGVNLPQGATISSLYLYLKSSSADDLFVRLKRHDMTNNKVQYLVNQYLENDQAVYSYSIAPVRKYKIVNNLRYTYGLEICVNTHTTFHGAIIVYKSP
jgi:hypothetical protein